ncbi:MAG: DUF4296 domain-containing protein [Flavobacterium sp.]
MRQLFILFFALFVVSCSKNPIPKPDNLLDEETMINILYDISLLQAIDGSMPNKLMEQDIKMDQYVFEKYKIDSTTYRQNQLYYAGDARKYKKIYDKVLERLEKENSGDKGVNQETGKSAIDSSVE